MNVKNVASLSGLLLLGGLSGLAVADKQPPAAAPEMVKFMAEVVKPRMAALLGLPEFDPNKPEAGGFGCAGCHTIKKE